jgi:hypothetical protein
MGFRAKSSLSPVATELRTSLDVSNVPGSQQKVDGDLIMMRDYEPQSDAATWRMLASATGMAAALSFGCVFVGTIVSALLSRLS